jgi:hypothetical protein
MATPIFCCGFECGTSLAHWTLGASASFSTSTVRTGARSLRCNPAAASTGNALCVLTDNISGWVVRFYVRFASLPTTDSMIASVNTTVGVGFQQSSSTLQAFNGFDAIFGGSGVSVTTGVWYRVDLKIDASANPWRVDAQIDGVAVGQVTRSLAASNLSNLRLGTDTSETFDIFYDDVIVSFTLGDYPLGPGYVYAYVPTSDGTHNVAGTADFQRTLTGTDILNSTTTAFQLVDNIPLDSGAAASNGTFVNMIAPPNASDYVECVFGAAPSSLSATIAPRSVDMVAAIAQAGTGTGNMAIRLNDNGTTDAMYSATTVAGVTTYAYKRKQYATPPTGGSWKIVSGNGNFNGLRVRYGSPAAVDANPDQYFSSTMIEAEFQEITIFPAAVHREIESPYFSKRVVTSSGQKNNIRIP